MEKIVGNCLSTAKRNAFYLFQITFHPIQSFNSTDALLVKEEHFLVFEIPVEIAFG